MTSDLTWDQAIFEVLKTATEFEPMYYGDIASAIVERGLRANVGKTPEATVRGSLSRLRKAGNWNIQGADWQIVRPHKGYFYLLPSDQPSSENVSDVDDELDATDETGNLIVAAYGLHWEREDVDWSTHHLWGYDANLGRDQAIDFADQQGVYLLHSWQSVVYVGKTAAKKDGMFSRLQDHHKKPVWSAKWERFSWFGIRQVDQEGNLVLDGRESASSEVLCALMEAVLIETLRPSFNQQQGNYMGTLYRQAVDPNIARARAQAVLRSAIG